MLIYIDSANLNEIKKFQDIGFIDGVTTNPTLVANENVSIENSPAHIKKICDICPGLISAEVYSNDYDGMLIEAEKLCKIADNIVIKLPCTTDGLKTCKALTQKGIKTNVTLVFSPLQALMAAKMGATIVSPFIGRMEDGLFDGIGLVKDIKTIFTNYQFKTKILSASFRSIKQISEVAKAGSDITTLSPELLGKLVQNPLTDIGLAKFQSDAKKI
jgi:transaldolase